MQIKKLAVAAGAAGALGLSLLSAAPASADYAPSAGDIVGVGSDTLQFAGDFLADGDPFGNLGYNAAGNVNKVINFDATPDANARLAYGAGGAGGDGGTAGLCEAGTGDKAGTVNVAASANTGNTVCQMNPTIVLRAGQKPVQRLNGSGAGTNGLAADIAAGTHNIDFARSSSNKDSSFAPGTVHRITIGTEKFAIVAKNAGNMPPTGLTTSELTKIYQAATTGTNLFGSTGCPTWKTVLEARSMPAISAESVTTNVATITTAAAHGLLAGSQVTISGFTTNTALNGTFTVVAVPTTTTFTFAVTTADVSGTEAGTVVQTGSNTAIVPLIPQAGSGTRSYFQGAVASGGINVANAALGNCVSTVEENDPTAVNTSDRIEPVSGARLNLFLGKDGSGNATAKYFLDPSCAWGSASVSGAGTAGNCGTAAAGSELAVSNTGLNSLSASTGALTLDTTKVYTLAVTGPTAGGVISANGTAVCDNTGSVYPHNISNCTTIKFKPSVASTTITATSTTGNITAISVKSVANSIPTPQTADIDVVFYDNLVAAGHGGAGAYAQTRSLYIYVSDAMMNNVSTDSFGGAVQPGLSINRIRALFANPCSGTSFAGVALLGVSGNQGCSTSGGIVYGPGGRPYIATTAGQALVASSGITPGYSYDF